MSVPQLVTLKGCTQLKLHTYVTPDDGHKFTELYNVQLLTNNTIDPVNKVCITTIQRLYSMLRAKRAKRNYKPFIIIRIYEMQVRQRANYLCEYCHAFKYVSKF